MALKRRTAIAAGSLLGAGLVAMIFWLLPFELAALTATISVIAMLIFSETA